MRNTLLAVPTLPAQHANTRKRHQLRESLLSKQIWSSAGSLFFVLPADKNRAVVTLSR